MLKSLFIMDDTGLVLIEKHWRGITPRDVCDDFWKDVLKHNSYEEAPAVKQFGDYYMVHIYRSNVFFAGTVDREIDPLLVIELLHRVHNMLKIYFIAVTPAHIKRNFSVVYQLLEEMVYNGVPNTTEPNMMQQMISNNAHLSTQLASGATSVTPWRKSGVNCAHNEIFFDVIEEIDAIVSSSGMTTMQRVNASIQCICHLSGYPEVVVSLGRKDLIKAISMHPSVRVKQFHATGALSFVPPDGPFQLCKYRIGKTGKLVELPLYVRPQITMPTEDKKEGTLVVILGRKPKTSLTPMTKGKSISTDNISVLIPKLDGITLLDYKAEVGQVFDDGNSKMLIWKIRHLPPDTVRLKAKVAVTEKYTGIPTPDYSVMLRMTSNDANVTGVTVKSIKITREKYAAQKAVRYLVCTGNYTVRA